MKKLLSFSVWLLIFSARIYNQDPVEYSDAIAKRPDSDQQYQMNDTYEKVQTVYENIYATPDYERGYSVTFFYEDTCYEPRGVHINKIMPGSKRAKGVKYALSRLQSLVERSKMEGKEILAEARYSKIKNRYKYPGLFLLLSGKYIREVAENIDIDG